jgi:signal transduction histidine kinase
VRLNESNNYRVTLDIYGINGRLEAYLEHVLYRSILESINNILHHAYGTEINIQIIGSHDDITVMIEDNGKGFDTAILDQNKGLGMKSTLNRIESLKGSMFIDSKIGKGTIVTFIVPSHSKKQQDSHE